jgi:hypothetical protein
MSETPQTGKLPRVGRVGDEFAFVWMHLNLKTGESWCTYDRDAHLRLEASFSKK